MSYFDSKTIDYFRSYGKLVSLWKSCRCGAINTDDPMPNIVARCKACDTVIHSAFYKS